MPERAPAVSVLIPAYEAERYIDEAIESVLAQSYRDYEILVVDDGSRDATAARAEAYGPRLRLLRQANAGPSRARNAGIEASRGRYVAFLDADDVWMPDKLEAQIPYLEANPDVGLVFADNSVFGAEGELVASFWSEKRNGVALAAGGRIPDGFARLFHENFILTSSVVVRRAALERVGGFDESLRSVEDRDLWLRIAHDAPIASVPRVLVRKRAHGLNISDDIPLRIRSRLRVIEKLERLFPETLADRALGADALAAALHDHLGRAALRAGELAQARRSFRASLRRRLRARPLALLGLSLLGRGPLRLLRALRRSEGRGPGSPLPPPDAAEGAAAERR